MVPQVRVLFWTLTWARTKAQVRPTEGRTWGTKLMAQRLVASRLAGAADACELVAFAPLDLVALVGRFPSQRDAETRHHRVAAKVHRRTILVAGLMIAVRNVVFRLLRSPFAIVPAILVALVDGKRRNAGARKAEVVGAIVMSGFGTSVGNDLETELMRRALDRRIERGALGARDVHLFRNAERWNVVKVERQRDVPRRQRRMLAEILRAEQPLLFRSDRGEVNTPLRRLLRRGVSARDLQQDGDAGGVVLRAVVDVVARHSGN